MDCFQTITWIVTNECKFGCHYCKFANRDVAEASLEAKLGALDVMASWPDADRGLSVCWVVTFYLCPVWLILLRS